MPFFATSPAVRTSLIYITVGALTLIWTSVWLVFVWNNPTDPPRSSVVYYWIAGFMASGIICLLIGFGLGRIGKEAHKAELEVRAPAPVVMPASPAVVQSTPPEAVVPSETVLPVQPVLPATNGAGVVTTPPVAGKPTVNV